MEKNLDDKYAKLHDHVHTVEELDKDIYKEEVKFHNEQAEALMYVHKHIVMVLYNQHVHILHMVHCDMDYHTYDVHSLAVYHKDENKCDQTIDQMDY
jgi:hypothetical protein